MARGASFFAFYILFIRDIDLYVVTVRPYRRLMRSAVFITCLCRLYTLAEKYVYVPASHDVTQKLIYSWPCKLPRVHAGVR